MGRSHRRGKRDLKAVAFNQPAWRRLAHNLKGWPASGRGAAVLLGALMLSWPALYNGFPLLYPDSMTYLGDGPVVARALFLRQFSSYYGVRSFFYSLGILGFHWNLNPWPVVALQCLLVAWVVWLVARLFAPRYTIVRYLALVLALSLLTSIGWYSSFIMPDVLGPILYLAIFLLVFAPETLSRGEKLALYPLAVWAATAHATHLVLAGGLCLLLAGVAVIERKGFPRRMKAVGGVAAIIAVAAGAQMALHGYLYGKPSLNGERPPYLTARIIADGPGRRYLENHCGEVKWAVCDHLGELTDDPDGFLWGADAVYEKISYGDQVRMRNEEMPFVLATIRAYPREQLARSAANFNQQLFAFGLYGFDSSTWILEQFDEVVPKARPGFVASRQARDALPLDLVTDIQWWSLAGSLVLIVVLIPVLWRRHSPQLAGLGFVVATMVVANAAITGVLSVVDDRYGCRVIWLAPLLAGMLLLDWLSQRKAARANAQEALAASPGLTRSRSSLDGLK